MEFGYVTLPDVPISQIIIKLQTLLIFVQYFSYLNMSKVIIVMTRPISESVTPTYDTTSKATVCSSVNGGGSPTRAEISYTRKWYNIDTNYCVTFKQFFKVTCVYQDLPQGKQSWSNEYIHTILHSGYLD